MTDTGRTRTWEDVPHELGCPDQYDDPDQCVCLRSLVLDARSWARHGFELGQRSCTWSDQGVAPAWLTSDHDYRSFVTDDPQATP